MQVSQRRADGVPIPIRGQVTEDTLYGEGGKNMRDPHVDDAFEVRVIRVLVDGVDVGLTGQCRTVQPAPVHLTAPSYHIPFEALNDVRAYLATLDPTSYWHSRFGGQLSGTLDLPPFTGCTTKNGDDLSAMMTLSVSGPGNRVVFRTNACGREETDELGRSIPVPTGQYTPDLYPPGCPAPDALPYPDRPGD